MFRVKKFNWLSALAALIVVLVSVVPAAADTPPPSFAPVTNIPSNIIVGEVANPGVDSITYSIQAENTTYSTLSGGIISAIIPDGTNLISCWAENPGQNQCLQEGNTVKWFVGTLNPDYAKTSVYVFSVSAPANPGMLNSQATFAWTGGINDPATGAGKVSQSPVIKTKMPADKPAAQAGQVPAALPVPGMAARIAVGMDVAVDKDGKFATFAIRSTANQADVIFWGQQKLQIGARTIYVPVSSRYYMTIPNGLPVVDCGWGTEGTHRGAPSAGFCSISPDGTTVSWARSALQNYFFTVPWDGQATLTSQGWWTWGTVTGGVGMNGQGTQGGARGLGIPNQDGNFVNAQYAAPVSATPALLKQKPSQTFCPSWALAGRDPGFAVTPAGTCTNQDTGVIVAKPNFDANYVTKLDSGIPSFQNLIIGYGSYLPTSFGLTANVSADKSMVTYAMRYRNGTGTLAGVKVFAPIPGGATLVNSGIGDLGTNPGVIDEFGNISWNIGNLGAYTSTPLFVWTIKTNGLPSLQEKGYLTYVGGTGKVGSGSKPINGINTSSQGPVARLYEKAPIPANLGPGQWLTALETARLDTDLTK